MTRVNTSKAEKEKGRKRNYVFLTFNIIIKINIETNIISVCFKPELKVMILYWGSQHRVRVPLRVRRGT